MDFMNASGRFGLAFVGAVVMTAMSACLPKSSDEDDSARRDYWDSGWYDYVDSGWNDGDRLVGPIYGTASVAIRGACHVVWNMSGNPSGGEMDLVWSTTLSLDSVSTCGEDTSGTFMVDYNAVYFEGDYWGAASSSNGAISWSTGGYVTGAGGYDYYYYGYAYYSTY